MHNSEDHRGKKIAAVFLGEYLQEGYLSGAYQFCKSKGVDVFFSTVGRRERLPSDQLFSTGPLKSPTFGELNSVIEASKIILTPLEAGFDLLDDGPAERLSDLLGRFESFDEVNISTDQIEDFRSRGEASFRLRLSIYLKELLPKLNDYDDIIFVHAMAGGSIRHPISIEGLVRVVSGELSIEEFGSTSIGKAFFANVNEVSSQTFKYLVEQLKETPPRGRYSVVGFGYHGTKICVMGSYKWISLPAYFPGQAKMNLERISEKFSAQGLSTSVFNCPEVLTGSSKHFPGIVIPELAFITALLSDGLLESDLFKSRFSEEYGALKKFDLLKISKRVDDFFSLPFFQEVKFEEWPQSASPETASDLQAALQEITEITGSQGLNQLAMTLSKILISMVGEIVIKEAMRPGSPVFWIGHDLLIKNIRNGYFSNS